MSQAYAQDLLDCWTQSLILRSEVSPSRKGDASPNLGPQSAAQAILQTETSTKGCITLILIEYPASMSQKDFFSIWAREAQAALGAKKAGLVLDIWKCVGTRRVIAVVNVDSLDTLDQILLDLPIMKEHGQHVRVDVTPLRRFERLRH